MRYKALYREGVGKLAEYVDGALVWAHPEYYDLSPVETHVIMPDLPGYQSPVTGKWIEGRRARREDMARTGSRPWEGMEQEQKEASRRKQYEEQKQDARLHEAASRAWYQLDPRKRRRLIEGR